MERSGTHCADRQEGRRNALRPRFRGGMLMAPYTLTGSSVVGSKKCNRESCAEMRT